jgi:hypothetical protein
MCAPPPPRLLKEAGKKAIIPHKSICIKTTKTPKENQYQTPQKK